MSKQSKEGQAWKWISVLERLPTHDEAVLATDGRFVSESRYTLGKWIIKFSASTGATILRWDDAMKTRVTHWMPLPEPPKEIFTPTRGDKM